MSISGKPRAALLVGLAVVVGATAAWGQTVDTPRHAPAFLAAGDDVVVVVFREKDLSARVYVDDRNQVALPRIGVLNVGTLTSQTLQDTLRAFYGGFLRNPSVDVRALRRVTVNGAVTKPDVYYVDPSFTVRDVIARASGVAEAGDTKKVSIVRGGVIIRVPGGAEDKDETPLRSGDEIVVGRRSWLSLNVGAVVGIASLVTSLALAFRR